MALKRAHAEGQDLDEVQFAAQESARDAMDVLDDALGPPDSTETEVVESVS